MILNVLEAGECIKTLWACLFFILAKSKIWHFSISEICYFTRTHPENVPFWERFWHVFRSSTRVPRFENTCCTKSRRGKPGEFEVENRKSPSLRAAHTYKNRIHGVYLVSTSFVARKKCGARAYFCIVYNTFYRASKGYDRPHSGMSCFVTNRMRSMTLLSRD